MFVKSDHSFICASPDGISITDSGQLYVLEIKCPSSCKGKKISVPYLEDGELKKSHAYYTQVQLQLFCCNLDVAHFFVYSDVDYQLLEIHRDNDYL